ncbi:MAG: hypothetical protein MRZ91_05590 [Christensenellaceae bacterium]|nr:hypothetical protein [Christensenellaceae bacterium]
MKKVIICILAVLAAFSLLGFASNGQAVSAEETWQPSVVKGVLDNFVPVGHYGGSYGNASEYGSKLIPVPERGANRGIWELSLGGGWGSRYSYDYTVDFNDFEITLDFSHVNTDGSQVAIIFGVRIGDYLNVENGGFGVKICRHNNQYGVVISNTDHTRGIEEMSPSPVTLPWDSQNSGYVINSDDGIITVSFKKTGNDFSVKLNGNEYAVAASVISDTLGNDLTKVYFAMGSVSDATEIVRVVSIKENNSAEYDKTVPEIAEGIQKYVAAANGELDTPEKILNAETLDENSGYENLLRHDKKYYESAINGAKAKIVNARNSLNTAGKIALLKADTNKLKEMLDGATTNAALASAEAYAAEVKEKDIDGIGEVAASDKTSFDNAVKAYEEVVATTEVARKRVVSAYVSGYKKLAESIGSVNELKLVEEYRRNINVNLSKLSQQDKNEMVSELVSVQEKVSALVELPGWSKSENELTFNGGKFFEFSSVANAGSTTYEKPFKVNDISFEISTTGKEGWIAVSLSRKAEPFHYNNSSDAGIEEMQSNPSLVLMFTRLGGNKISMEVLLIKSTHTSFFSASRGTTVINYSDGDTLKIVIKAKDDVNSSYADIYVNGEKFTGTPIKNSELKGAVGSEFKGYLSIVKLGKMSMRVDKINDKDATSDKITEVSQGSGDSSGGDSSSGASDTSSSQSSSSGGKKGCGSDISGISCVTGVICILAGIAVAIAKKRGSKI